MANEFGLHMAGAVPPMQQMQIDIYSSDGTPTASGPRKGALCIDYTTPALFINTGTADSATWNNIQAIAPSEIALAEGNLLVGNSSSVATSLNAKTSGQILVGNGTTLVSVAVSADATLASSGAVTVVGATGAFNIGTNVTLAKEVNHTVTVTTSTTATSAGGNLSISAGIGATSGNGGIASLNGGQGGATGAGGIARVVGGAGGATSGAGAQAQVTGGAGTNANANGGDVVITGGAANGSGVSGKIMHRSLSSVSQGAPTAKTVSATLTAAELLAGIITVNQGAAGASAQQLPLATDLDTALPGFAAGDAFDVSIINTSTVDAEDASVTTNTGWTLVGSMDFHAYSAAGSLNSSGLLRLRKTGTGAWVAYRIS